MHRLALLLHCLCASSVLFVPIAGSMIKFASYPPDIKANLTRSLTMRCSLTDTDIKVSQIGKRDVTVTTTDIRHVTSIMVTRNNDQLVASVTPFDPPTAVVDSNNLEAKGDASGTSSEGLLDLTWQQPSTMTTGEYVCEINAITDKGHNVVFSTSIEVTLSEPTINDLVEHINGQDNKIQDLENKVHDNEVKIGHLQNKGNHIETGSVALGSSAGWKNHNANASWDSYVDVTRSFSKAYPAPPVVFLSVSLFHYAEHHDAYYDVTLLSVDATSFTVRTRTWANYLQHITVNWISFEN